MTQEDFLKEENAFLKELEDSTIYRKTKELSKQIEDDEELQHLSKERDSFYEQSYQTSDPKKKEEYQKKGKEIDDRIQNHPLVKEYNFYYQEVRKVLNHLNSRIFKELKGI